MTYLSLISVSTLSIPPDYSQALQQTMALCDFATKQEDFKVSLLAYVIQLKILIDAGRWNDTLTPLKAIGEKMNLMCLSGEEMPENSDSLPKIEDPFSAAMAIYALVLGTLYHTQVGSAKHAASTLGILHSILDRSALEKFPDGIVSVSLLIIIIGIVSMGSRFQ
jgi:hypothetical protein